MSKNVAVFVDVANIFYAAKAAGADIDYVTLLKAAVAGRDFVRAYAYTGLDPENENQRNFHQFLARHGYKVVSKDIRKYGDGKVKANLDIELVVDLMKTARNLDVAIVVSGDGDFAPAIRAVQEMGVRVEVISFRGNTSSDLIDAADAFYDITTMARVDRDSSRSGRRVANDEEDLSMTEVPDKQTEGRSGRRGRGRGRSEEPARGRRGGRAAITALPGEKLSKAAAGDGEPLEDQEALAEGAEAATGEEQLEGERDGRRRRRRGGRGRGHGRSREELGEAGEAGEAGFGPDEAETASTPRSNQFGSVWDSQIGMAGRPERIAPMSPDEDDFAEPEIPEYLLAERRAKSGGRGRGQGGRGVRSAYASAVERERYGRSGMTRYPEPARGGQPPRRREEQPRRRQQPPAQQRGGQRGGSSEPWSEVPPEIEELLRASLTARVSRPERESASAPESAAADEGATRPSRSRRKPAAAAAEGEGAAASTDGQTVAKPRSRRKAAAEGETGATGETGEAAPKKRAPARRKTAAAAEAAAEALSAGDGGEPAGE